MAIDCLRFRCRLSFESFAARLPSLAGDAQLIDRTGTAVLWVIVDRLRGVLVIVALVAPFALMTAGVLFAARRDEPHSPTQTGRFALRGFGLGVIGSITLLFLASCYPPPGEGILARDGYGRGALVVDALDRFKRDHGQYPDSLTLVSQSLDADILARPSGSGERYRWRYQRSAPDAFVLSFQYTGPGMNTCELRSDIRRWTCSGYF
jgi:hypothetical protein